MPSLRRRVLLSTGLLFGVPALCTVLAVGSWREVLGAAEREQVLAEQRAAVAALGEAAREQYVHQAHTFIEGGAGHLAHHEETESAVREGLEAVGRVGVAEGALTILREDIERFQHHFREHVVPEAHAGTLDRARAARLHAETEQLAVAIARRVGEIQAAIDVAQGEERARAATATARAWQATAALTFVGVALSVLVARRMVSAVLGPVEALRVAAHAVGRGESSARAPVVGDDELVEVAHAFNAMVDSVGRAEERRVRSERLAALGEMSAAVAHELLNPLTVILGDPALRTPELASARQEAEHARRIVEGMLGFARPGADPPTRVDLARAAQDAADRVALHADAREVRVDVRARPVEVTASPSAVRQVLDNLLRNAVEASPDGGVVEVEVLPDPAVRVLDRGPGIPPHVRGRLYEPFATGRAGGTGLGLAVCHRIVRAQGGELTHRDREGGGTVATWEIGGV
ncbi:MAG: sensor histidine kinase [Myxococcota bacterium]